MVLGPWIRIYYCPNCHNLIKPIENSLLPFEADICPVCNNLKLLSGQSRDVFNEKEINYFFFKKMRYNLIRTELRLDKYPENIYWLIKKNKIIEIEQKG